MRCQLLLTLLLNACQRDAMTGVATQGRATEARALRADTGGFVLPIPLSGTRARFGPEGVTLGTSIVAVQPGCNLGSIGVGGSRLGGGVPPRCASSASRI